MIRPLAYTNVTQLASQNTRFLLGCRRWATSGSSKQWLSRQKKDPYVKKADAHDLMSRAAFKLMEIDDNHQLFMKPGMTTVDLGFAPGSWSQVAVERSKPNGRVIGVDILPCRPPPGATAIQGNFLAKSVQDELKAMLVNPALGRPVAKKYVFADELEDDLDVDETANATPAQSYLDMEKTLTNLEEHPQSTKEQSLQQKYPVDLVLSDMWEPWPQKQTFWLRSINDPFIRMANTSGNPWRDHAMSMVSEAL